MWCAPLSVGREFPCLCLDSAGCEWRMSDSLLRFGGCAGTGDFRAGGLPKALRRFLEMAKGKVPSHNLLCRPHCELSGRTRNLLPEARQFVRSRHRETHFAKAASKIPSQLVRFHAHWRKLGLTPHSFMSSRRTRGALTTILQSCACITAYATSVEAAA